MPTSVDDVNSELTLCLRLPVQQSLRKITSLMIIISLDMYMNY